MADNSKNRNSESINRTQQSRQGSGQQTGGTRGQKLDKEDKEHYRSSEQKKQRGNHGGNR